MIKIVAENYIKKELIPDFMDLVSELIQESRKESGCISYALYQDRKDETHLTFIEEWKDEEAIAIHNSSKHFTQAVPHLGEFCYKSGSVATYKEVQFND